MRAFLSSTFEDLAEHRRAVYDALERLGVDVSRMEAFGARPEEPRATCLGEIDRSDIFVGIYAHRYGSVAPGGVMSITAEEFLHARGAGKALFCFLVADDYPWPADMIEGEPGLTRLEEFKRGVEELVVRDAFRSPEDLAMKVVTSIGRYIADRAAKHIVTPSDSLPALRSRAIHLDGIEHVVDGEALGAAVYPALMDMRLFPAGTQPISPITIWPGQWLEVRFFDAVVAVGAYYQQRLYSTTFVTSFRSGRQETVAGTGWPPGMEFFGTAGEDLIARLIVQPQAHGSVLLRGIYAFARQQHHRDLRKT